MAHYRSIIAGWHALDLVGAARTSLLQPILSLGVHGWLDQTTAGSENLVEYALALSAASRVGFADVMFKKCNFDGIMLHRLTGDPLCLQTDMISRMPLRV